MAGQKASARLPHAAAVHAWLKTKNVQLGYYGVSEALLHGSKDWQFLACLHPGAGTPVCLLRAAAHTCSGMTSLGCPLCTQPLYSHSDAPHFTYSPRARLGSSVLGAVRNRAT